METYPVCCFLPLLIHCRYFNPRVQSFCHCLRDFLSKIACVKDPVYINVHIIKIWMVLYILFCFPSIRLHCMQHFMSTFSIYYHLWLNSILVGYISLLKIWSQGLGKKIIQTWLWRPPANIFILLRQHKLLILIRTHCCLVISFWL